MKNTKFLVKVNRGGARAAEYVLRIDRTPIQTTTNKKLALAMGRFTAEDAVKLMAEFPMHPRADLSPGLDSSTLRDHFSNAYRSLTLPRG